MEEDEVYKFQIFVQVRIIYIGGFQGKVLTGKRVCDLSVGLQRVLSVLEKRKRNMYCYFNITPVTPRHLTNVMETQLPSSIWAVAPEKNT